MKGVFSFSFRVESAIAPTAQLLIYTVLPNGEVIADTEKLKIENCFANKVGVLFKPSPFIHPLFRSMENKTLTSMKRFPPSAPKTFCQRASKGRVVQRSSSKQMAVSTILYKSLVLKFTWNSKYMLFITFNTFNFEMFCSPKF